MRYVMEVEVADWVLDNDKSVDNAARIVNVLLCSIDVIVRPLPKGTPT